MRLKTIRLSQELLIDWLSQAGAAPESSIIVGVELTMDGMIHLLLTDESFPNVPQGSAIKVQNAFLQMIHE